MNKQFIQAMLATTLITPAIALADEAEKKINELAAQGAEAPKEYKISEKSLQSLLGALDVLQGPKHSHIMQIVQFVQKNVKLVEECKCKCECKVDDNKVEKTKDKK